MWSDFFLYPPGSLVGQGGWTNVEPDSVDPVVVAEKSVDVAGDLANSDSAAAQNIAALPAGATSTAFTVTLAFEIPSGTGFEGMSVNVGTYGGAFIGLVLASDGSPPAPSTETDIVDNGATKGNSFHSPLLLDRPNIVLLRYNGTQFEFWLNGVKYITSVGANPAHAVGRDIWVNAYTDDAGQPMYLQSLELSAP